MEGEAEELGETERDGEGDADRLAEAEGLTEALGEGEEAAVDGKSCQSADSSVPILT